MRILIIGNSDIFKKKIYFALKKIKKIKIELASTRKISNQIKIHKKYRLKVWHSIIRAFFLIK